MSGIKTIPIVMIGHEILRSISTPVESSSEVSELIDSMILTMKNASGVGLAAPQINIGKRFFVCRLGKTQTMVVNPIIKKARMNQKSAEGCLSIPGLPFVPEAITRYDLIDVEFYDINMVKQRIKLSGYDSIVFQHELDHLNGVMFLDHMTNEGRDKALTRLHELSMDPTRTIKYDMIMPDNTLRPANV